MSKKNDIKVLELREVEETLKKSIYKYVLKSLRSKARDKAKEIVDDIADPNNIAEVDPDKLPPKKMNVMNKSEKGIYKLKSFVESRKKR